MRFIYNNKLFDTEKSELIYEGKEYDFVDFDFWDGNRYLIRIYKTKNNSFFYTRQRDSIFFKTKIEWEVLFSESCLKKQLVNRISIEKYEELFGKLEDG